MRFLGYVALLLLTAIAASYWPLTPYLPEKESVVESVQKNAPFIADLFSPPDDDVPFSDDTIETLAIEILDDAESEIWNKFDLSQIQSLLTDIGVPSEIFEPTDTGSYVFTKRVDEYNFILQPELCTVGDDCLGLSLFAYFNMENSPGDLTILNQHYAFMKFYQSNDDRLVLQKYIIADDGIAYGTAKVYVLTFIDIMDGFEDVLNE